EVTKKAVERARKGGGPTLIEAKTFRMKGHAEHDDAYYVPKEVFKYWEKRDPIKRYEQFLLNEKFTTAQEVMKIQNRVKKEMDQAQKFAEESPLPGPEEAGDGLYAE
ncbi:MAG: thiamine pyrophosphate-dependent enzyme, partial [bacterium]